MRLRFGIWLFIIFCISSGAASAQDCCNCPGIYSDMQCSMMCDAMIPRCTAQVPRAPVQQNGGNPSGGRGGMCVTRCVPGGYVSGGDFCGSPPHACPMRSLPPRCSKVWVPN
jgi:hypothetical protein